MLAGIGPVKPFWAKYLIAHSEVCGRRRGVRFAQRGMRCVGGEPGRAKGTHRYVSAVRADIAGGTLPTRPG